MSDEIRDPSSEDRRLEEALAEYLLAEEQGRRPGRDSFLGRYPALADRLRAFLDNKERLEGIAGARDLATTSAEATPPPAAPSTAALPASSGPAAVPGYEVLGELGRGGMGVVYKARHLRLKRVVALKMILSGAHAGAVDRQRFQTEAEAVARLQHPGIVQIYEIGEHGGLPFFSLEFCPGGSLEKKLHATPLPPRKAATVVEGLARAMQVAHQKGVVHRDLKPANVLIGEDGTLKITDFGLAKKIDEAGRTATGAIMGTPSYMAPEQAGGSPKAIGPAADVYALGAILYQCLTGRPPFRGTTSMETLLQVLNEEPVPPSRLQSTVPPDLETICLKCLSKEPRKRYASAVKLAEELGRFRRGEPVVARPVRRLERAWRWSRRNPALAGLLALVALLLVSGTVISALFALDAAEQARVARDKADEADGERRNAEKLAEERASALRAVETEKGKVQEQLAKAKFLTYVLRLREAQAELERGRPAEARAALRKCDPNLCHWEHDYLLRQTMKLRLDVKGHTREVNCVAFSADGTRIVSGSQDRTVKVWDAQTGQETLTLKGHTGQVNSVAFSPDGQRIASGSSRGWDRKDKHLPPGEVKVWDTQTGQELLTLKGHTNEVMIVAFSADSTRIAVGSGGEVKVWEAQTGKETLTLKEDTGQVFSVAFSADGKRIVSGSGDNTVKVWDAQTGQEALTLKGASGPVAFSPDGKRLAAGSGDGVKVWDAHTGQLPEAQQSGK